MNAEQLKEFTTRQLMALLTARADGDDKSASVIIDALAKAYGLENYPPR
jgi:hypothetical protein